MTMNISFTLHVPVEWLAPAGTSFDDFLQQLFLDVNLYALYHNDNLNGFVYTRKITAFLVISVVEKIWWMRRIRIEDDDRDSRSGYYPPLTLHDNAWIEYEHFFINNNNNNEYQLSDYDDDDVDGPNLDAFFISEDEEPNVINSNDQNILIWLENNDTTSNNEE